MADKSHGNDGARPMMQLQAHLTKRGEDRERLGVKLQSGQAERLMCDLEAVRSAECTDSLPLPATPEQEEHLASLERTQVLHQDEALEGAPTATARQASRRNTVQERALTGEDAARMVALPAKSNSRDQRLRKMEGPADTAKELAKKLTYFTYYELLYLDDDVSTEEIHAAYIKRTTEIRSRFRSGIEEWRLTEFLRALHEAHTVLTNSKLRQEYDSRLAAGDWEGTFQDLISKIPDLGQGAHWSGSVKDEVSLKDLLLCAGFVTQCEVAEFCQNNKDTENAIEDGPELAQILADAGLITFEELASVLLGKALIDRRQITVDQFKQAVGDMRNHSHKLVDALVNQGWLTPTELHLIGMD
jgi:hypothetical protein